MEKVEINFKTRIKNEEYRIKIEKPQVSKYKENMKKIKYEDVKDYVLTDGKAPIKFKNFLFKIKELFSEINLPHKAFNESMIIEIDGKTLTLFKHTNKSGNAWFHFSDLFKAKKLKSFYNKLKNFLKDKIGKKILNVFNKFEKIIFEEFTDEISKLGNKIKNIKTKFMKDNNSYALTFHSVMSVYFSPFSPSITFNVNEDLYKTKKDKFLKLIENISLELKDYIKSSTNKILITVRPRPYFMLG